MLFTVCTTSNSTGHAVLQDTMNSFTADKTTFTRSSVQVTEH